MHPNGIKCTKKCVENVLPRVSYGIRMVANAPKWYEIHQNMSLGTNRMDRVGLLRKILTQLRVTNFCTSSARFAPSFVRQPNGPKCTQMVCNSTKHEFRVQWGGSSAFVVKNSDATSWHELLHKFGPFCTKVHNASKIPKCTQIVKNAPKHQFRVQRGGPGLFFEKNSDVTSWHELLH